MQRPENADTNEVRAVSALSRIRPFLLWLPFLVWVAGLHQMLYSGRFPGGDAPHVLGVCMRMGWYLRSGQWGEFFSSWVSLVAPHPPGGYLLPALLYAVAGPVWFVPWLAGILCLALIWDAILRMLRATGARGAWGVALTLAAAPLIWKEAEFYGMDLVSATAVAQCLSHLMASRGLTVRRSALLAGLWLGIGVWIKYTFPLFLFLPCAAIVIGLIWDRLMGRGGIQARVANGFRLLVPMAGVLAPLGLLQGRQIARYIMHSLNPTEEEVALMGSLGAASNLSTSVFDKRFFYAAVLKDLWGWPGIAILTLGLAALAITLVAKWRRAAPDEPMFELRAAVVGVASAIAGVLVLSTFQMKADRYALPMVFPLVAMLVPPLSGRRWALPAVLIAMLPPLVFVFMDFAGYTQGLRFDDGWRTIPLSLEQRTHAPAIRNLEHPAEEKLSTWGHYPLPDEAYRPISDDPRRWEVALLLEAAGQHLEPSGEWLGLFQEEGVSGPGFGHYLMTAERLGLHWDFATIKLLPDPGTQEGFKQVIFQGPFVRDETPEVEVLIAFFELARPEVRRFLEVSGFKPVLERDKGQTRIRLMVRDK